MLMLASSVDVLQGYCACDRLGNVLYAYDIRQRRVYRVERFCGGQYGDCVRSDGAAADIVVWLCRYVAVYLYRYPLLAAAAEVEVPMLSLYRQYGG